MERSSIDLLRYPRKKHKHRKMDLLRRMRAICETMDDEGFQREADALIDVMMRMAQAETSSSATPQPPSQPAPQPSSQSSDQQRTREMSLAQVQEQIAQVQEQIARVEMENTRLQQRVSAEAAKFDPGARWRKIGLSQTQAKLSNKYRLLMAQLGRLQQIVAQFGGRRTAMSRSSQADLREQQKQSKMREMAMVQNDLTEMQKQVSSLSSQGTTQAFSQMSMLFTQISQKTKELEDLQKEVQGFN